MENADKKLHLCHSVLLTETAEIPKNASKELAATLVTWILVDPTPSANLVRTILPALVQLDTQATQEFSVLRFHPVRLIHPSRNAEITASVPTTTPALTANA
jgi:hypothetical protein